MTAMSAPRVTPATMLAAPPVVMAAAEPQRPADAVVPMAAEMHMAAAVSAVMATMASVTAMTAVAAMPGKRHVRRRERADRERRERNHHPLHDPSSSHASLPLRAGSLTTG
jgi:hypothetical protein